MVIMGGDSGFLTFLIGVKVDGSILIVQLCHHPHGHKAPFSLLTHSSRDGVQYEVEKKQVSRASGVDLCTDIVKSYSTIDDENP
jgi:hypothetical protein